MRLMIHLMGVGEGEKTQQRVERRLGFALNRHGDRIGRVDVYLNDINGPRGGIDKRCRIVITATGHKTIIVEDCDSELDALIDRTADRLGHVVGRQFDRARTPRSVHGRRAERN